MWSNSSPWRYDPISLSQPLLSCRVHTIRIVSVAAFPPTRERLPKRGAFLRIIATIKSSSAHFFKSWHLNNELEIAQLSIHASYQRPSFYPSTAAFLHRGWRFICRSRAALELRSIVIRYKYIYIYIYIHIWVACQSQKSMGKR